MKNIRAIYFSPTGGTRKAALSLAGELACTVNESALEELDRELVFGPEDVILAAVPVFGGRIPAYTVEKLKLLKGDGTVAVTTVVYGNRAVEDALLELNDILREQGFRIAASAALLAEHSMVRQVAAGRPDEKDKGQMREFGERILEKLDRGHWTEVQVPGSRPYKDWKQMPVVPSALENCTGCGLCQQRCPAKAIPKDALHTADPGKCILCLRCIAVCPQKARKLPEQAQAMLYQKLMPLKDVRRENEIFL